MKKAVEAVTGPPEKSISVRVACRVFNVKFATLVWHLNAFKISGAINFENKASYDVKKMFTDEEELKLVDYIKTIAKMNYDLSKKQVRELAYKFAMVNKKRFPFTWKESKIAGEGWIILSQV